MIVTTFDKKELWNKRNKPATVRIDHSEQGRIVFSVEAVKLMGLKEGMRIQFRHYSTDGNIVYIYEQATGYRLQVTQRCQSGVNLAVFCRPLCTRLLEVLKCNPNKAGVFKMTADKVKMPDTNCDAWMIIKKNKHKPIKSKR